MGQREIRSPLTLRDRKPFGLTDSDSGERGILLVSDNSHVMFVVTIARWI